MTMTLDISNIGKSYGKRKVLDSISFSVRPGQIVGLLGPNGAGKSTLLNIICSLLKADHGQVTFNGQAYHDLPQPVTTVGTMLNPEWLDTRLSCHDLLLLHASRLHLPVPQRSTHTILKKVSLDKSADRKVSQLSLGMRQRLALGLALLADPDLLILDEPINGLDADGVAWMRDSLISFAQAGKTVLLSSHLMSEMEITASHVAILNQGRIQKFDSLQNLQNSRATVFTTVSDPSRLLALLADKKIEAQPYQLGKNQPNDSTFICKQTQPEDIFAYAEQAGTPLRYLALEHASLESIYFELLNRSTAEEG